MSSSRSDRFQSGFNRRRAEEDDQYKRLVLGDDYLGEKADDRSSLFGTSSSAASGGRGLDAPTQTRALYDGDDYKRASKTNELMYGQAGGSRSWGRAADDGFNSKANRQWDVGNEPEPYVSDVERALSLPAVGHRHGQRGRTFMGGDHGEGGGLETYRGGINEAYEPPLHLTRIAALDATRGVAVAMMIVVEAAGEAWRTPGGGHPFGISGWTGLRWADFVMPLFIFVVGASVAVSTKRNLEAGATEKALVSKAVWRCLKLGLLGVLLHGSADLGTACPAGPHSCSELRSYLHHIPLSFDLATIRLPGTLQRIAFCYIVAALLELLLPVRDTDTLHAEREASRDRGLGTPGKDNSFVSSKRNDWQSQRVEDLYQYPISWLFLQFGWAWAAFAAILAAYLLLAALTPPPPGCGGQWSIKWSPDCNAAQRYDRWIFGGEHLQPNYRSEVPACNAADAPGWCSQWQFDPEGLVASLGAVLGCLLGCHYAHALVCIEGHGGRLKFWSASSVLLIGLGVALHFTVLPAIHALYTPSFMLITTGSSGLLFCAIYALVDLEHGGRRACRVALAPFSAMGANAFGIFVFGACCLLDDLLALVWWRSPENNIADGARDGALPKLVCGKPGVLFAGGERCDWALPCWAVLKLAAWMVLAVVARRKGWYWRL